jgi:hypothetical protein
MRNDPMGIIGKITDKVSDSLNWRRIKVIGGDIEWDFNGGMLTADPASGNADVISLMGEIKKLTVQTEESVKDLAKTLGFTIAGAVLLGPFGAVAGYFAGGRRKEVCILTELKDGRRFVAIMDQRIYQQMLGLQMMAGDE